MPPLLTWISGRPAKLRRIRDHLPEFLAFQASLPVRVLFFWLLYRLCVPRRQDAPLLVLTMGKVGTIGLETSLRNSGVHLVVSAHRLSCRVEDYPHFSVADRQAVRWLHRQRRFGTRWFRHLPRVRVITAVREPIARLISLYLFAYAWLFDEPVETAPMERLLERFPRLFDREYNHPLVPGEFFATEIQGHLGIDIFAHASPAAAGWTVIEERNVSLLLMKTELPDRVKETAVEQWLGRRVSITRHNTAEDLTYASVYGEFKRRVRIPYRYAEQIYASRFMQHFYTAEERAASWRRWEPQLDRSLSLPAWLEASLDRYHPPLTPAPVGVAGT